MMRERWGREATVVLLLGVALANDESAYEELLTGTLDASAGEDTCSDSLPEELCDGFLEAGWCGTGRFTGDAVRGARGPEDDVAAVRRSCRRTCGLCLQPGASLEDKFPAGKCEDLDPLCADWAAQGYCDTNRRYMVGAKIREQRK
eukprot:CAMPEP_0118952532 /NCGR_PEP_ID=MMETSP1169-20130426/55015_1 /TAXON_ID=36882 /ORGANISM="Pyramimonas obovata, Strain CCMP722" /LENGTH=145 /DNA_ID=CAMNT_0006899815 /DNA_START=255 /DNA_END=689 /DNA_ORIENTATION=+